MFPKISVFFLRCTIFSYHHPQREISTTNKQKCNETWCNNLIPLRRYPSTQICYTRLLLHPTTTLVHTWFLNISKISALEVNYLCNTTFLMLFGKFPFFPCDVATLQLTDFRKFSKQEGNNNNNFYKYIRKAYFFCLLSQILFQAPFRRIGFGPNCT